MAINLRLKEVKSEKMETYSHTSYNKKRDTYKFNISKRSLIHNKESLCLHCVLKKTIF